MLGGPRFAAKTGRKALCDASSGLLASQSVQLDTLVPTFLCPAIQSRLVTKSARSTAEPSSSSSRPSSSSITSSIRGASSNGVLLAVKLSPASQRCYSSHAVAATRQKDSSSKPHTVLQRGQSQLWQGAQRSARPQNSPDSSNDETRQPASTPMYDWRRKFPSTQWRREMDFNRYSPPLRRRYLPEDAPALYEDEIKASAAWLPDSQWTLNVPDDYPLRHELFLILDSLDDVSQSAADPDCAESLAETLRQARELIWSNQDHPLRHTENQDVALYLAGKVAETYVKLDAEDSMDRLMAFLDYVRSQIGVLPLPCFHALAALSGIIRRYDAVLKICRVAQEHHNGKADAELLHLRLRAVIAQSKDIDLTRYWDFSSDAGIPVPRKTFDLLLRTHIRRQDIGQVNEVLGAMPQHGHEVDAKAWLTILRGFQSFRPTLATMLRRDARIVQSPTLDVVNGLLVLLSQELDVDGALMVLRIFRIPSIRMPNGTTYGSRAPRQEVLIINGPSPEPDVKTYAILTQMFGRLGRSYEARSFFRLALEVSDKPSRTDATEQKALQVASAWVMTAHLNAGHPLRTMAFATRALNLPYFGTNEGQSAPSVRVDLPKSSSSLPLTATTVHYRILLECASAIGSTEVARKIIVHLLEQGHDIDQEILRGLARLIFSTIDKDALESIRLIRRLWPQSERSDNSQRSQRLGSLSDVLQHLGAFDKVVLASQHSTDLNRSSKAISKTKRSTSASSILSLYGKHDKSSKDELRDWLIKDSSSLFRGFFSTNNAGQDNTPALSRDLSRPLSPAAYAMRIRVYAVVRRDYESAQKVYHAMLAHNVKPNMMHIAPLIEGLTAVGKLDEAQQLKHNAKEVTGFQPTLRMHTALIRAYVRAGDSASARKEIRELTDNGYKIDDTIANIIEAAQTRRRNFSLVDRPIRSRDSHSVATRFHILMRMRRYLAAQELIQSTLDSGMRPDKVLHDLVRRSVSHLEKEHAKALAQSKQAAAMRHASRAPPPSTAGTGQHPLSQTENEMRAHVYELAQAKRLAAVNRERIGKVGQHKSEIRRQQMKVLRKKVVSLVLDFADGKLHDLARQKEDR